MTYSTHYGQEDDVQTGRNQLDPHTKQVLDLKLFTPLLLKTEQGIHTARNVLGAYLLKDGLGPLQQIVESLMQGSPYLLGFALAVTLDEHLFARLKSTLLSNFPEAPNVFAGSLACTLIEYLRDFFIRLAPIEVPRELNDCHRGFQTYLTALAALQTIKFKLDSTLTETQSSGKGKQSQRQIKHARRQSRTNLPRDSTPFVTINESVPNTPEEAAKVAARCLDKMKVYLKSYLTVLRSPDLVSTLETLYLDVQDVPEPLTVDDIRPDIVTNITESSSQDIENYSAFPQIQPMKAARYFSEPAEGFGSWILILSSRAIQHLKRFHREDQSKWGIIKRKLQQLSQGFFSDDNHKLLSGNDNDIPVYEAKLTRDLRIIYQIDVVSDDEKHDQQVLKVWGIHTHAQIDKRLWKAISRHQTRIGGEYRSRCLYRKTPRFPGQNVIDPASWDSAVVKVPLTSVLDESLTCEEQLELHSVLVLEKFTRMTQTLMNNIIADQDAVYPFELTGAEQKIRDYNSSCFVLGRSGTGKTTTMIFKMMNIEMLKTREKTQHDTSIPVPALRQLFVTQSRILASRVREYFTNMMSSQTTGHKLPQELERLAQKNRRVRGEEMMDLEDDEDGERADLPKKFSELKDEHFPLFLTMDQLSKLLEADCNLSFKRRPRTKEHRRAERVSFSTEVDKDMVVADDDDNFEIGKDTNSSLDEERIFKASIVSFDTFLYAYWPHFPQALIKCLDPGLVYNEFLGVIKGSEETLKSGNGINFLDRQTYLQLSERTCSTFSGQRAKIYDLFEHYSKRKSERDDYDAADRTHAILRAFKGGLPFKQKVDYLYIDEVQDNLIIDARLLRMLCVNPHGLFWAGDTAQTISMGSSFRFDDLKAFIYRTEKSWSLGRDAVNPALFQLNINYRSHAGVVNCAHSIVELITKLWPNSIDTLAQERGIVDGPRPVFFAGWNEEAASYEQFFFHTSLNIELGAQQCILVRDDRARESLRRQIGEVGLIMTLYEAKGLEFNDVLLYNFFSDSTVTLAEWRVVLNMVQEDKRSRIPAPRFDQSRHATLCSELKSLYVGITRARSHVWILDTSKKGEPMRVFWESYKLIQSCRPGDPQPKLAVKSTPEQWAQQGYTLFNSKHFKHAMLCFDRAAMYFERSVAYACLLRQSAQRLILQEGRPVSTANACILAAEAFVVCAGISPSIAKRNKYFSHAANLYSSGGYVAKAAQAYLVAEKFTQAAQHFKCARLFDEAADVVLFHRDKVDANTVDRCINIARLHLHREGHIQKAERLFDDRDQHLEYLEEFGFDNARMTLLQHEKRWTDVAELHFQEGQYIEAIQQWRQAGDAQSQQRANLCLFDVLWRTFPLGADVNIDDPHRDQLLELLDYMGESFDEKQTFESAMFDALLRKDDSKLLSLARGNHRFSTLNPMVTLLCLDHVLSKTPHFQNDSPKMVSRFLEDYDAYAQLMRSVISDWQRENATALLGITMVRGDSTTSAPFEFRILSTSILHKHPYSGDMNNDDLTIRSNHIRVVLGNRLMGRLKEEHGICLQTKVFRPCLHMAINKGCNRLNCQNEHIPQEAYENADAFNLRIRLHMQQLLIVHHMDVVPINQDRDWMRRIWLERLYDCIFPIHYLFGHRSALVANSIPEYQRTIRVLSDWVPHRFYSLRPYPSYQQVIDDRFLTDVTQAAKLAFVFDSLNATHYVRRAHCVVWYRPPPLLRGDGYVVHDLLQFLESSSVPSIICGAHFINHILDRRLTFDVSVLLTLVDSLFGRAILIYHHYLHTLTLPRSWLVELLPKWQDFDKGKYIPIDRILFKPLRNLLEGLCSEDVDYLRYHKRPLSFLERSVAAFRICRCLTLLGYNIKNGQLRHHIFLIMNFLNRPGRTYSPLIAPFIKATHWSALARAARTNTNSPLDDIIVMRKDEQTSDDFMPPPGVKLVRYAHESEVFGLLAYQKISKLDPGAVPFIPQAQAQQASMPAPEEDEEVPQDEPEVDEIPNLMVEEIDVAPNDLSIYPTEKEIDAAKTIQVWYRRRLALRLKTQSTIDEVRSRMWHLLHTESKNIDLSLRYCRMFLGPLSHILTALYVCGNIIKEAKKSSKQRLRNAKRLDLDQENDLITSCSLLLKIQIKLWKDLEPRSKFHISCSIPDLKTRVEEVNDLIKETNSTIQSAGELKWDMQMGYKGIVRIAPPPQATATNEARPSLNTEDIDF